MVYKCDIAPGDILQVSRKNIYIYDCHGEFFLVNDGSLDDKKIFCNEILICINNTPNFVLLYNNKILKILENDVFESLVKI